MVHPFLLISFDGDVLSLGLPTVPAGLPWWLSSKTPACQCRRGGFDPWVEYFPWRKKWLPTPVFLPGKIPWTPPVEEPGGLLSMGPQEWDMTKQPQHLDSKPNNQEMQVPK